MNEEMPEAGCMQYGEMGRVLPREPTASKAHTCHVDHASVCRSAEEPRRERFRRLECMHMCVVRHFAPAPARGESNCC